MPENKQIHFAVDNRRNYIGVQIVTDGTVTETIALDSQTIDQLIVQLASLRIQLKDPVPSEPTEASLRMVVNDPRVAMRAEPLDEKKVLFLRHPGLGWLGFAVGKDTWETMAQWLIDNPDHLKPA